MITAVIQMNSGSDIKKNLHQSRILIDLASRNKAQMVILPENFCQMPNTESQRLDAAEAFGNGPIQAFLSTAAAENKLWIIAGSISIQAPNPKKVYSSCLVYDENGQCQSRYDKQHLFDIDLNNGECYKESGYIQPGNQGKLVNTPLGRIGLSICYDLRFPEYFRYLHDQGAQIITVPSAFTKTTGAAHWLSLLRARAIENQLYILAPGQTGKHDNGRETFGHSVIYDPWGNQLDLIKKGKGIIYADIDIDYLKKIRKQMPCLKHRRSKDYSWDLL